MVQSEEVDDDPFDPYDELTLAWRAGVQSESTNQYGDDQCAFTQSEITASGSATGTDVIRAGAVGDGAYELRDVALEPDNAIDATSHTAISSVCGGGFEFDQPVTLSYDRIAYRLGNSQILPTDKDANHYVGELSILHYEQPQPGGMQVVDQTMHWDLHRHLAPGAAQPPGPASHASGGR